MAEEKRQERIKQVANSLKMLHVVSTMEEAIERAKEIVGSTDQSEKSIKELMAEEMKHKIKEEEKKQTTADEFNEDSRKELEKQTGKTFEETEKNIESAEETRNESKAVHGELEEDIHLHELESGDIKEAKKKVKDIQHAVKDVEEIVEEAEEVQGKSS